MIPSLVFLSNHLWQSTLVAAFAWLICRTVLKHNSPAVRFAVWLAVSVKFLVPFALFVEAGHRLYVRPVLTPTQARQVFNVIQAGTYGIAATPFRASPASPSTDWTAFLVATSISVWALGAIIVFLRWFAAW